MINFSVADCKVHCWRRAEDLVQPSVITQTVNAGEGAKVLIGLVLRWIEPAVSTVIRSSRPRGAGCVAVDNERYCRKAGDVVRDSLRGVAPDLPPTII